MASIQSHRAPLNNRLERLFSARTFNMVRNSTRKPVTGLPYFMVLPMEMHYMIKESIPNYDLFSHVAWSEVLAEFGVDIYMDEQFWEKACRSRGFTLPKNMIEYRPKSWVDLATYIVRHFLECQFGGDCIYFDVEGHRVRAFPSTEREVRRPWVGKLFAAEPIDDHDALEPEQVEGEMLWCDSFKTLIKFDDRFDIDTRDTPNMKCFTRWTGVDDSQIQSKVQDHLATLYMFATVPPMKSIQLDLFGVENVTVENENGVTVGDVLPKIQDWIREPLPFHRVMELYNNHGADFHEFRSFTTLFTAPWGELIDFVQDPKEKEIIERTEEGKRTIESIITLKEELQAEVGLGPDDDPDVTRDYAVFDALTTRYMNAESVLFRDLIARYSHVLAPFCHFSDRKALLHYSSASTFLQCLYFSGIEQQVPGSNVFLTMWDSTKNAPIRTIADRAGRPFSIEGRDILDEDKKIGIPSFEEYPDDLVPLE